MRFLVEWRV